MSEEYPTRTIFTYSNCTAAGQVTGYCERWVVPLTTVWTAPNDCPTIVPHGREEEWYETCAPPNYEAVFVNDGYYSPGVCPSGYTVGCQPSGPSINNERILTDETVGMCVPSGYTCNDLDGDGSTVFWGTISSRVVEATTTRMFVNRPAFQIRWKSEDIDNLPFHPLTPIEAETTSDSETSTASDTASSGSTISVTSSGSGPTATSDGDDDGGGGGLGTGAIAGIAVGAVAGIALIGALVWFLLRRRKQHQPQPVQQSDPSMSQYVGSPGPGGMQQQYQQPYDQQHQQPYDQQQYPQQYAQQPYQHQQYQQYDQPYAPAGAAGYYDKNATSEPHHYAAYAQQSHSHSHPSPSLQSTSPGPTAHQHPPTQFAQPHPPGLVHGSDMEVVPSPGAGPAGHHGTEQGEEWERHQLLQRQHELQQHQSRLEIEQIQREQMAIQHRLSQMPPPR